MNRPFDLEAAKRGEKIEYNYVGGWGAAYFIGTSASWLPVVQNPTTGNIFSVDPEDLRMAAKKATLQYRRFEHIQCGEIYIDVLNRGYHMFPDPSDLEKSPIFRKWIDFEWQTAEVEV